MEKNPSPDPPFISHYAIIQGEMGLFLTFSVFELQRGYLYQNGVEFRQKVIGAGLNLFWGHLHYFSGGIWTFPLLSDTYASAPIAERAISYSEDDMKKNIKSMRQCEDPSVGLLQPQKASCRRRMCLSHCITNDSFIY